MKTLLPRFTLAACCLCTLMVSLLVSGCRNNLDCQSPPPQFSFKLAGTNITYPVPTDTAASIKIYYLEGSTRKYISDLRVMDGYFHSMEIIWLSRAQADPEFTIEIEDQPFTTFRFKTYINKARCQGWATISEVYQNNKVISRGNNWWYVLSDV